MSALEAKLDQKNLSMAVVFFFGTDGYNYISARTESDQKISSSPLPHLATIDECRSRAIKFYNFGVIVAKNQTKLSYYGFSYFKRSFGVEEVNKLSALDLVLKPIRYLPIYIRQKQYKYRQGL